MAMVSMGAALAGLSLSVLAAEQTTIFNTKDFHKDKALWNSPAYYRNNTPAELVGMALNIVPYQDSGQIGAARLYGSQGTGKAGATNLASPYPFQTPTAHYHVWVKGARGGRQHTAR